MDFHRITLGECINSPPQDQNEGFLALLPHGVSWPPPGIKHDVYFGEAEGERVLLGGVHY